jgi:hypothetical protein
MAVIIMSLHQKSISSTVASSSCSQAVTQQLSQKTRAPMTLTGVYGSSNGIVPAPATTSIKRRHFLCFDDLVPG